MSNKNQPQGDSKPRCGLLKRTLLAIFFSLLLLILISGFIFLFSPGKCSITHNSMFVQFAQTHAVHVVPQGEESTANVSLSSNSFFAPDHATIKQGNKAERKVPLNEDQKSYSIPLAPIQRKELLTIQAGNAKCELKILPKERPSFKSIQAHITLPAYMGGTTFITQVNDEKLSIPVGASLKLHVTSSQHLTSASATKDNEPIPLTIKGNELHISPLSIQSTPITIKLFGGNADGLTNKTPLHLLISPRKDQAPSIQLTGKNNAILVLENSSIELELEAHDDHGIRELGIEWACKTPHSRKSISHFREVTHQGNKAQKALHSTFVFSPSLWGITPQEVVFTAFSNDYSPGRKEVKSTPLIIRIVNKEEHALTLRSLVDRLEGELHDISEKLKESEEDANILTLQTSTSLLSEICTGKIIDLADSANNYASKIDTLSSFARHLFLEGSKNEEIDPDGMKQLLSATAWITKDASQAISLAEKTFAAAVNETNSLERRNALTQGLTALNQLQAALKTGMEQFDKSARSIASSPLIKRLKKIEKKQEELTTLLTTVRNKIKNSSLPPAEDQLQTLSVLQEAILDEILWIKDDLELLKSLRKEPSYTQLNGKITQAQLPEMIRQNITHLRTGLVDESIRQSNTIARTLDELSELIHERRRKPSKQSPYTPSVEQNNDLADSTFELTLRLIRIIQKQEQLRLQTEESLRRTEYSPSPELALPLLAQNQDELQADILDLILLSGQGNHAVTRLMEECRKAMNHAVDLLDANQHGKEAIQTQNKIISLLGNTAMQCLTPPHERIGKNTACLLNILKQIPAMSSSSGKNTPLSVPPADCTSDDIPEEFRQAFDAYRKTLQH